MLSQAKEEIILSTYDIKADISGKQVLATLLDAADRGVKVSIVTDGVPYVTSIWGNPYFLALAGQENVEIKIYNPLRFWQPRKLMGRLHDKYLIVDRSMYILGGRNTYDFFLGDQPGYQNYDWDMLVCVPEGKKDTSLEQVRDYFSSVWKISDCKLYGKSPIWKWNPSVKTAEGELRRRYKEIAKEHPDWIMEKDYTEETVEVKKMTLLSNPTHVYAKEPVVFYEMTELMKQAEKINRPIITFVNTSGAYPGKEAEENGQGEAIARNLYEMSGIQVPILCLMIGEGGSGGALALAVGNEVWMMENATYSILSPEGFASILWKDGKRAKEAATVMKITAQDLKELSVVDKVIPEYGGADDDALTSIAAWMKGNMKEFLRAQNDKSGKQLAQERYDRFRKF